MIMSTEYMVQRVRRGVVQVQHGPYDSLDYAETCKKKAETRRETTGPGEEWRIDTFRIVERDVTPWIPIPKDVGDCGQLND